MKAEKLLDWALENIHSTNWRMLMTIKVFEKDIKKLSKEQIEAIDFFMKLVRKGKFYQGAGAVVSVDDMDEVLEKLKKLNKNNKN